MGGRIMPRTKLVMMLTLFIASLALGACSLSKGQGSALAYDISRTKVIPGAKLPDDIHLKLVTHSIEGTGAGFSEYQAVNASLIVQDTDKTVVIVQYTALDSSADLANTTSIPLTDAQGKSLIGMSKEEIVSLYGEPSLQQTETPDERTMLTLYYCYKTSGIPVLYIVFHLPKKGDTVQAVSHVSVILLTSQKQIDAFARSKYYNWPKELNSIVPYRPST